MRYDNYAHMEFDKTPPDEQDKARGDYYYFIHLDEDGKSVKVLSIHANEMYELDQYRVASRYIFQNFNAAVRKAKAIASDNGLSYVHNTSVSRFLD